MHDELTAIKKSLACVDGMQTSLEMLNTQVAALIIWQKQVVIPALQQVRNATEELSNLKPQVTGLMQWKTKRNRGWHMPKQRPISRHGLMQNSYPSG